MILGVEDIDFKYDKKGDYVLNDVSINFPKNMFTALVGANGCGKSTLMQILMGIISPLSGNVVLDGQNLNNYNRIDIAKKMALLSQSVTCPDYLTVGELVGMGRYSYQGMIGKQSYDDLDAINRALKWVGLEDIAHRYVSSLSGGQKQRAWIAMVLSQDTDIILLDEPVNHLDVKHQYAILNLSKEFIKQGKTVIAILHDLNHSSLYADYVVMMKDGKILYQGNTKEVLTKENIKDIFDFDTEILEGNNYNLCLPKIDI